MLDQYTWLFAISTIVAFLDAFGIGANDVANSFNTSVASGCISYKQAIFIAIFTEALGAGLLGSKTSKAISNILQEEILGKKFQIIMLMMFCSLVGSSTWTLTATKLGWPVSTTHSIIGGVIGSTLSAYGPQGINWYFEGKGVLFIVCSWFISPITAGCLSAIIFILTKFFILSHPNSFRRGLLATPFYFGLTTMVTIVYISFKHVPIYIAFLIGFGVGLSIGFLSWFLLVPWLKRYVEKEEDLQWYQIFYIFWVPQQPKRSDLSLEALPSQKTYEKNFFQKLYAKLFFGFKNDINKIECKKLEAVHDSVYRFDNQTEFLYGYLQVISACMASFAHGSNDVANSLGPLSLIYNSWEETPYDKNSAPPLWALFYCICAIDLGLMIYGYKVMRSLGSKITFISPSRGFSIELGTCLTVLTCSFLELPVSTTHCITGATAAIGLCNGSIKSLNWNMLGWCFLSCILTVPCSGSVAWSLFYLASKSPKI